MAAFSKIKVGDVLWDCRRTKMGNTTMTQMSSRPVLVREIDSEKRRAFCSWNYNAPTWWGERKLSKLRRTAPK